MSVDQAVAPIPPETPALSPSCAYDLMEESPLTAWTFHRLFGGVPKETTSAKEAGRLYHALLLEGVEGQQKIAVCPYDSFRSKAAMAARDFARSQGMIPVAEPKYQEALLALPRIQESLERRGYRFGSGFAEQKLYWHEVDRESKDDVLCTGVPDWIASDYTEVRELKFMPGSAHPERACIPLLLRSHGIYQWAAYTHAIEERVPELAGRVVMKFLFCQTDEPFQVVPMPFGGGMQEISGGRWQRAVDTWARCRRENHWPPYVERDYVANPSEWLLKREMETEL